jgi:hypothetical protein
MSKYKTLKIDGSFPDSGAEQLTRLLEEGWWIHDKTVVTERYIFYVLKHYTDRDPLDSDVGKTNGSLSHK